MGPPEMVALSFSLIRVKRWCKFNILEHTVHSDRYLSTT